MKILKRIFKLGKSFGCKFKYVDDVPSEFAAPFHSKIGLDWKKKTIIIKNNADLNNEYILSGLIHEMAHAVASTIKPNKCEEYDFLGWEFIAAKQCGFSKESWLYANGDYEVGEDRVEGSILSVFKKDEKRLNKIIKARVKYAVKSGLLQKKNDKYILQSLR